MSNGHYLDATEELQKFRIVMQDIWNQYCWSNTELRDWDVVDHYREVERWMIDHMLKPRLARLLDCENASQAIVYAVPSTRILPAGWGANLRISDVMDQTGEPTWLPDFVLVHRQDVRLEFCGFYDWSQHNYRSFQYLVVRIARAKDPQLEGRYALLEHYCCNALAMPAQAVEAVDTYDSAVREFWP